MHIGEVLRCGAESFFQLVWVYLGSRDASTSKQHHLLPFREGVCTRPTSAETLRGGQITNLPNRGIETQFFKGNGYATSKRVGAMK